MAIAKNKMGKKFESNFKEAVQSTGNFIYRIKDTDSSYHHTQTSLFTKENPCDFFMYDGIYLYPLELKSTCYNSISIQQTLEDSKMIKMHQIKSLTDMSMYKNIRPGFIFNFRKDDAGVEHTYFLSIEDFNEFYANTDKQSINETDIILNNGIPIESTKRRVYFTYNMKQFFKDYYEQKGD